MKTIYLIKSLLPMVFLPLAPGVLQIELAHHAILTYEARIFLTVLIQIALTILLVTWFNRRNPSGAGVKAFLKMSCVSKKVFHQNKWISVEQYLAEIHNITVSHGMTPEESTAWLEESEAWLVRENGPKRHVGGHDVLERSDSLGAAK